MLQRLVDTRFQGLFTPLAGVLFAFPSWYLFAIGRQVVFSLGRWSSQLPTGFLEPRGTQEPLRRPTSFAYGAITRCGPTFQTVQLETGLITSWKHCRAPQTVLQPRVHNAGRLACIRFRLFPVRSPLLGESRLMSFPGGTEMFQFPPLAPPDLWIQSSSDGIGLPPGFPIRRSPD